VDGAREATPQPVVTLSAIAGARDDDGGLPEVPRWCCSKKMALVALTNLANYMCVMGGER